MSGELLRLQHGTLAGHDLVLRRQSRSSYLLAVVTVHQGPEIILHSVFLKSAELAPLAKVLLDLLSGANQ